MPAITKIKPDPDLHLKAIINKSEQDNILDQYSRQVKTTAKARIHHRIMAGADKLRINPSRDRRVAIDTDSLRNTIDRQRAKVVRERLGNNLTYNQMRTCSGTDNATTAHCLRFSDLWYNLHSFDQPRIVQELSVQVFQKKHAADGSLYWVDLTRGQIIK